MPKNIFLYRMNDVQDGEDLPKAEIILDMEGMSMRKLWSPKGNKNSHELPTVSIIFEIKSTFSYSNGVCVQNGPKVQRCWPVWYGAWNLNQW